MKTTIRLLTATVLAPAVANAAPVTISCGPFIQANQTGTAVPPPVVFILDEQSAAAAVVEPNGQHANVERFTL